MKGFRVRELLEVFKFLSGFRDGEFYAYIIVILYARGLSYDFSFLLTCFFLNLHWQNILMPLWQDSRPIIDDSSLLLVGDYSKMQCG
jgi:hypothetical protein